MPRRLLASLAAIALCAGCAGGGAVTSGPVSSAASSAPSVGGPPATPVSTMRPVPAPTGSLRAGESLLTLGVADALPGGVYLPSAPAGGTDDYRCFLADPKLTSDAFVTGVQFLPGDPRVVHHAILFRVEPSQVTAALAKDAADPRPGWECFGGPGLPATSSDAVTALDAAPWVAGWAPGGRATVFADGFGVPLPRGSRVVIQMHYNLRAAPSGVVQDDTHVRLRISHSSRLAPLTTMLLPAPVELPCPVGVTGPLCTRANSVADVTARFGPDAGRTIAGLQLLCGGDPFTPRAGVTQTCVRHIRASVTVRAAAGHMHLLGRSIRIVANAGTPRERLILDIPVWNFDDQSAVPLARPVALRAGDTVTVTCTHDPSLRGKLPALQGTAPRYVVWGEGTTDEMCLGILVTS